MRTLFLFALLLAALPLRASEAFEPVASIEAAALAAVVDAPGTTAEVTLDPALRLPRCPGGLSSHVASPGTVEVSCNDAAGWRLFVPVRVQRVQAVVVLARAVQAGATIGPADVQVEMRDAARLAGAPLSDPAQAIGHVLRRTLRAGSALAAGDLVAPRVVERGDTVTIVSGAGGLQVRMSGRALRAGGVDERIAVENLSSRRVVQGVIGADGAVYVVQ